MTEYEALLREYWDAVAAAAVANSGLVNDVTCSQKHEAAHKMHQQVLEHVSTLVADLAALKARLAGAKRIVCEYSAPGELLWLSYTHDHVGKYFLVLPAEEGEKP